MSDSRERFEKFISSPPFERTTERFADYETWPDYYIGHGVQMAWEAWSCRDAEIAVLEAKVEMLELELVAAMDGSGLSNVIAQHESQLAAERGLVAEQAQEIAALREAARCVYFQHRSGGLCMRADGGEPLDALGDEAKAAVRRALEATSI